MDIIENIREEIIKRSNEFQEKTKGTKEEYNLYESHVKYVYKIVCELIKDEDNIDKEVLLIATLLHDVAMTNPQYGIKDHAENGVILAQKILNKYNYPQDKIDFVKKIIRNHSSSRKEYRTTKEENILVDADALSHFYSLDSIYSLASKVHELNEEDSVKFVQDKLTKDYNEISLKAKEKIKYRYYQVMKANTKEELLKNKEFGL